MLNQGWPFKGNYSRVKFSAQGIIMISSYSMLCNVAYTSGVLSFFDCYEYFILLVN